MLVSNQFSVFSFQFLAKEGLWSAEEVSFDGSCY
jgi:hypothetical protein